MAEYRIVVINDLVLVGRTRNRLTIFNLPMLPTKILLNYALNTAQLYSKYATFK